MAAVWEQLDDEDDEQFALWAAMVAGFDMPSLSEQLAAWRPPWMASAACKAYDVATFFPPQGHPATMAREVCAGCEVREPCARFGADEPFGIWGGLGTVQRKALRRAG